MSLNKPKLSVYQAIKKSFIAWGIKTDTKMRIYYKWELEERTRKIRIPCIVVDYDQSKREWYITLFNDQNKVNGCTIDDITGAYSILT